MRTIRLKLAELYDLEGDAPVPQPGAGDIERLVLKRYGFLPQPLIVVVEGDEVLLSFQEESATAQAEAKRLTERAEKRAADGHYEKAVGILKRALELQPSYHGARRDLAMAYVALNDVENATNHLIEVLRLDPRDPWSLVVLANLYIRAKRDKPTGEKFLRKALEISPNDPWALNSLAGIALEGGQHAEALRLFEQASTANPQFANAYYGEAMTHHAGQNPAKALDALERLFRCGKAQDARSKPVFEGARQFYVKLQADLTARDESEVFKLVQNYKADMARLSGFPIQVQEEDFDSKVGATLQVAWKHQRDFHLLKVRRNCPTHLSHHFQCHELTHLKFESEARKAGKNRFLAITAKTRETALRAVAGDIRRLERAGHSDAEITERMLTLVTRMGEFLLNCPVDMLIERHLRETFQLLRPAQFIAVRFMALEAWQAESDPDNRHLTPRKIFQASLTLNGAYGLFLDDLFHGATTFAAPYRSLETFGLSQRLHQHWQTRAKTLGPGEEYALVDEFSDMMGLRDWYEWRPDPGQHEPPTT